MGWLSGKDGDLIRGEVFTSAGRQAPLPDVDDYDLPDILADLGYCQSNGMGLQPLSFTEIATYLDLQDLKLSPKNIRLLKSMSAAFVSGQSADEKSPPYEPTETRVSYSTAKNIGQSKAWE